MCRSLFFCTLFGALLLAAAALQCTPQCQNGTGMCVADHGNLSCQCIGNWSGEDCSSFICDNNPCYGDSVCVEHPADRSQYLCVCPIGFTGPHCEFITNGGDCNGIECSGHGTCYETDSNQDPVCVCDPDHWGMWCEYENPDLCNDPEVNQCWGHGTCVYTNSTPSNGYTCLCDEGWHIINWCRYPDGPDLCLFDPSPCDPSAKCFPLPNSSYYCECPPDRTGVNCTVPFDVCNSNPCQNGGTCNHISDGHYFTCTCPPNYSGDTCEGLIDPCSHVTCENGGTCVPDAAVDENGLFTSAEAHCDCPYDFEGEFCEMEKVSDPCSLDPCANGGTCTSVSGVQSTCLCPSGFTGRYCETTDHCHLSPCDNNARCVNYNDSFLCVCDVGWGGQSCSLDVDECADNPCRMGGVCENMPGGYECTCPSGYTGVHCEIVLDCVDSECVNGECIGGVCACLPEFTGPLCEIEVCQLEDHCAIVAGNDVCDPECFTEACGYDGAQRNCFTPNASDPWINCPLAQYCKPRFDDGRCDVACNIPECLYDARECVPSNECPTDYCKGLTDNGVCDMVCNSQQCPFDYEDCDSQSFANGYLIIILVARVDMPFEGIWRELFLEELGKLTNSVVVVVETNTLSPNELEALGEQLNLLPPNTYGNNAIIYQVTLRLDIEYCNDQCVQTAQQAVAILQAYYSTGRTNIGPYGVADAYAADEPDPNDGGGSDTQDLKWYYFVVPILGVLLLISVVLGILGKRKRVSAKIWRPQSPTSEAGDRASPASDHRQSPSQPGAVVGTKVTSDSQSQSEHYIAAGAKAAKMDNPSAPIEWEELRVPMSSDPPTSPSQEVPTVCVGQIGHDARGWTRLHYEALHNPELVQQQSTDINTPGPGGVTPLMLAVTRKPTTDSSENVGVPVRASTSSDSSNDSTSAEHTALLAKTKTKKLVNGHGHLSDVAAMKQNGTTHPFDTTVPTLIAAGAKLDATNDFLQTALHLAAASARGDYVKQLLGSGANPNLQDNWGHTPLHTAIGACAEGAFMILLHHPKTNINAKCDGGFTPLMLAVKQVNQRMVKQLVKKNADITATDTEGRTALHWAAMLNNLESLKLLIRQGPDTIKDQQDNKGQTPLFLACREGAAPCVKHLLDCFANATLLDSLDRSPMQIAFERQHLDVVEMLKMSTHGPFTYQLHPHAHFQRPQPSRMAVYNPAMGALMEQETSLMQPPPNTSRPFTVPNVALKARKQPPPDHSAGMTYPEMQATSAHGMNHDQAFQMGGGDMQGSSQRQKLMRSFFPSHSQGQTFRDLATPELTTPNDFQLDALQTTAGYAPYSQSLQPSSTPHDLQTSPNMKPLTSAYMNGMIPASNDNTATFSYPLPTTSSYRDELLSRHQVPVTSYHMSALPTTSVYADLDLDRYAHAVQAPLNPPTSCYEQEDPAVSLSDIEPTVRELGDLSSVSQSSAGNVSSVTQNINYITPNIDNLPAVGYGMTPTSTIVDTTQSNGFIIPQSSAGHDLVSSSYCRTVYDDCHSCPQSIVSSSSLQCAPTYLSTTRPLQHLPVEMDPHIQHTTLQNGTSTMRSPPQATSAANFSTSPSSYYPSPPNCEPLQPMASGMQCHADPPSLTPSPETRDDGAQSRFDQFTSEIIIQHQQPDTFQPDYNNTSFHHHMPPRFVPHTLPVNSSRVGTTV